MKKQNNHSTLVVHQTDPSWVYVEWSDLSLPSDSQIIIRLEKKRLEEWDICYDISVAIISESWHLLIPVQGQIYRVSLLSENDLQPLAVGKDFETLSLPELPEDEDVLSLYNMSFIPISSSWL